MIIITNQEQRTGQDLGEPGMTPEQRTDELFSLHYTNLAGRLQECVVAVAGRSRAIMITAAKGFSIAENAGVYRNGKDGVTIDNIGNGSLWAFDDPRFRTQIPLVGALENGVPGACIQIRAASAFNRRTRQFVPLKNQREIVKYLGLQSNEVATLEFRDNTGVLYLVRRQRENQADGQEREAEGEQFVNPEDANNYLRALLGEADNE